MELINTNNLINDESYENQAIEINSHAFESLDLMVNTACKPFIKLLKSKADTVLKLPQYNQISSILLKFASSNNQIININENVLNQTTVENESLNTLFYYSLNSFVRFLYSHEFNVFTLNEYTQISNIIHRLISAKKQLTHTTNNSLHRFLDDIISLAMTSFTTFCNANEFKDLDLDSCLQIASITHKLASAKTQFLKDIKKLQSFDKKKIKEAPQLTNEVQAHASSSALKDQNTNSQTPTIEVPLPFLSQKTTSIHNKKLSRKLRKKLFAKQVAKQK